MRFFETYPPSSVMIALAVGIVWAIGGLTLVAGFAVGVGLMALGHRIDFYGVRRHP